jgi:hypothetical protein
MDGEPTPCPSCSNPIPPGTRVCFHCGLGNPQKPSDLEKEMDRLSEVRRQSLENAEEGARRQDVLVSILLMTCITAIASAISLLSGGTPAPRESA